MRAYLSLGGNLGDRDATLRAAVQQVHGLSDSSVTAISSLYETAPMGEVQQPAFLNLAAEIETQRAPLDLLDAVEAIERELGRERTLRWGPRTIDIDIVLYGTLVLSTPRLTLPHPRFRERRFVLIPLAEIAPNVLDPVTGQTIATLAASTEAAGEVIRVAQPPPVHVTPIPPEA